MAPQASNKWVYDFGGGASDGDASMKNLLGGKGANLAEMAPSIERGAVVVLEPQRIRVRSLPMISS